MRKKIISVFPPFSLNGVVQRRSLSTDKITVVLRRSRAAVSRVKVTMACTIYIYILIPAVILGSLIREVRIPGQILAQIPLPYHVTFDYLFTQQFKVSQKVVLQSRVAGGTSLKNRSFLKRTDSKDMRFFFAETQETYKEQL